MVLYSTVWYCIILQSTATLTVSVNVTVPITITATLTAGITSTFAMATTIAFHCGYRYY